MRESAPVLYNAESKMAQVFTYAETHQVVMDTADFSSDMTAFAPVQEDFKLFSEGNFVQMDPPEHGTLRGLVSKAFTPKAIADLEPRIAEIADELLADAGDEFDLVDTLAYPLPVIVIAEMLGIPVSDRPLFRKWADVLLSQQVDENVTKITDDMVKALAPTMREMNEYLLAHIRRRRADPGSDLTSKLTVAAADGRTLTDQEIVGFVGLLLIAGHITTTALLGNSLLTMDQHPGIFEEIRADRSLIPGAVEEFLRFRSPFPRVGRRSTKEVELGGVTIPADTLILPWLASANRDPAQFADPDNVNIHRSPNHHLSFSKGIHVCIGAPLARLEARVALNLVLDRYRDLRVLDGAEFFNPYSMAAVKQLPVAGNLV
jgi:cytochrome P450